MLLLLFLTGTYAQWLLLGEDTPPVASSGPDAHPEGMQGASIHCTQDGNVYVFGAPGELWRYEPRERRWLLQCGTPKGVSYAAYWTSGTGFYIFGGVNPASAGFTDAMWKYEPGTRTWTHMFAPGPSARAYAAFWARPSTNSLYLYGGSDGNKTLDDLWVFNTQSQSWRQLMEQQEPLTHGAAVLGNSEDTAFLIAPNGTLFELNLGTLTWTRAPNLPADAGRRDDALLFMSQHQDELLFFGGHAGDRLFEDIWVYTIATRTWSAQAEATVAGPSARFGARGCADQDGNFYLFGGNSGGHLYADIWKHGSLTIQNLAQMIDFKLDTVTMAAMLSAAMSTLLFAIAAIVLLCYCVKVCRRRRRIASMVSV
jgi:N-acetylneuraminic acid mutarotase